MGNMTLSTLAWIVRLPNAIVPLTKIICKDRSHYMVVPNHFTVNSLFLLIVLKLTNMCTHLSFSVSPFYTEA